MNFQIPQHYQHPQSPKQLISNKNVKLAHFSSLKKAAKENDGNLSNNTNN